MEARRGTAAPATVRRRDLGRLSLTAEQGFGSSADRYERGRPGYPAAAVDHIVDAAALTPHSRVVDLAAGTGKLTRHLVERGMRPLAIEPVAGMYGQLRRIVPGVDVVAATAELLPVRTGSLDSVVVAQAFHWFDVHDALAEIARVLAPGGTLVMTWNLRDESAPWVAEMSRIIEWHDRDVPRYDAVDWAGVVAASGRYSALEHVEVDSTTPTDRDRLADRIRSISYIAVMGEAERERLVADTLALTRGWSEPFDFPHVTHVHWCRTI